MRCLFQCASMRCDQPGCLRTATSGAVAIVAPRVQMELKLHRPADAGSLPSSSEDYDSPRSFSC